MAGFVDLVFVGVEVIGLGGSREGLVDDRQGVGKRSREALAPAYVRAYTEEILDRVDLGPVIGWIGKSSAALLCVERDPEACHRSLIAARLQRDWSFRVEHLTPGS